MAPSPKVKRTYVTRRKEAERLEKLAKENRKKKRSRDLCSDDDSLPSQTLGSFELDSSEIQIIPPWSDDNEVNGEEGDDGVEFLGRVDVGRCSGIKKDENFAKNVSVIHIDTSDEEEENMNEEPCSSYGSVVSLYDDEELDNSDGEEDEDYQCEKFKDQNGKIKKGNVVTSKYTCTKDLSLDESYSVDKFDGRKDSKGRDGESVKGKKKGGKVLILDESNGSSEGDSVVVIWPKENAFTKKKKGALP